MKNIIYILIIGFFFISCTKEKIVNVPVEVEKKTSWAEETRISGSQKIILSSGHGDNIIYFQMPNYFCSIEKKISNNELIFYTTNLLPSDINTILPISNDFIPIPDPYVDSLLYLVKLKNGIVNHDRNWKNIFLKNIDSNFVHINFGNYYTYSSFVTNSNGTLLLRYYNSLPNHPYTFLLVKVITYDQKSTHYPFIDTIFTKKVLIPNSMYGFSEHDARLIFNIDDYFILDLGDDGIYKLKEDGSFKKVLDKSYINSIYKYNNKIYAFSFNNTYISNDNSETFIAKSPSNEIMIYGKYFNIKDSLIGTYKDNIFTNSWNGNNYELRFLKNDGLETKYITGIETLGDSVYVSTLSGLFVKPLSTFFETKK